MKLKVLGSNSKGNGYLLDDGEEALLIECGMPMRDVRRAVDGDIKRIVAALITHEHGDHAKYVGETLRARIPCLMSWGTANMLLTPDVACGNSVLKPFEQVRRGGFTIIPFPVEHDAAEPFGFLIHHAEMGTTLFVTDTYYLKYRFDGLSQIMIECNYSESDLDYNVGRGYSTQAQRVRVMQSHMSLGTCIEVLDANDLSDVRNIVLLHLSPVNSSEERFRESVQSNYPAKVVTVAKKGVEIPFGKTPF